MVVGTVIRVVLRLSKMFGPVLKAITKVMYKKVKCLVVDVSVDVLKSSRLFIKRFFRTLVEAVWNRVLEEDVQERIWDKVDQWKMEKEGEEERKKQGEEEKKE
ncbi:unnamed protein product, partial [Brassica oleracea]